MSRYEYDDDDRYDSDDRYEDDDHNDWDDERSEGNDSDYHYEDDNHNELHDEITDGDASYDHDESRSSYIGESRHESSTESVSSNQQHALHEVRESYEEAYRLYSAALGRTPDSQGITNWMASIQNGDDLEHVASGFINSAEFQQKYGNLSNEDFVKQLYNNVLDRDPDAEGLANWVSALNAGASRERVLVGFSESAEHQLSTDDDLEHSFYQSSHDGDSDGKAFRLYLAALDRTPDSAGLMNWITELERTDDLEHVASGFINSAEFQQKYGSLSNEDFVRQLYNNVLDREPDSDGLANWVANLNSGETREQVLVGFSESVEHQTRTADLVSDSDYLTWVG